MAFYTVVKILGDKLKHCQKCHTANQWKRRVCGGCGQRLELKPPAAKPKRGTTEWLAGELKHAAAMSDRWTSRVKRAVTKMHYWARRERAIAARIAAGPQPPKPRQKPHVRRRALDLD